MQGDNFLVRVEKLDVSIFIHLLKILLLLLLLEHLQSCYFLYAILIDEIVCLHNVWLVNQHSAAGCRARHGWVLTIKLSDSG